MEKRHSWEIIFHTNSTANLPALPILKEVMYFFPKTNIFPKNPKFPAYLINLTISIAIFTANLLWFGDEKISNSESSFYREGHGHSGSDIFNWQVNVTKRSPWLDDFPSIFNFGRKIINENLKTLNGFVDIARKCENLQWGSERTSNISRTKQFCYTVRD